jgi:hypothetical protein
VRVGRIVVRVSGARRAVGGLSKGVLVLRGRWIGGGSLQRRMRGIGLVMGGCRALDTLGRGRGRAGLGPLKRGRIRMRGGLRVVPMQC